MSRISSTFVTTALLLLGIAPAVQAQETLELGVIRNDDITVVQKIMYPKSDRTEIGVHVGVMALDPFLTSPNAQFSFNSHYNEKMSLSVVVGGGYGMKTGVYKTMESPTYGVAPYAYRYLASALVGVEYSPIYAKMNLNGAKIIHFDVYTALRGGVSLEQSVLPDGSITLAPTVSPGVGTRMFLGEKATFRVEFRDDLLLERRAITQSTHFKQNANVTFGLTFLSAVKER